MLDLRRNDREKRRRRRCLRSGSSLLPKLSINYHKCQKGNGKANLDSRSLAAPRATSHQRFNNFLVPTSTVDQRRTKRLCHRTVWTTREPAASHPKRRRSRIAHRATATRPMDHPKREHKLGNVKCQTVESRPNDRDIE